MRILLIGKNGQVGWELQRSLATLGEIIAVDHSNKSLCGDLNDLDGIIRTIHQIKPDVIVNAAAYTAVDRAEIEYEIAEQLNARAVSVLAKESKKIKSLLVHYSTDYVFDGEGEHYRTESELACPLNVYGKTKLAGEQAIVLENPRHLIFRTSWVHASRGSNFIKTMMKLGQEKEELSIINDQHGAPTSAELLADCTAIAIREFFKNPSLAGTYHLVASGETTWYNFAVSLFDIARKNGMLLKLNKLNGIPTSLYPTPAMRPKNSRLSNEKFQNSFNVILPNWLKGVERTVIELIDKK
ncbi:dTDP-4-dehydrorhamnose reductase [Kluyvera genomosp. 1]|uniref:dTDP-4-dehydrorhamnose reductase n=1 Tax=Kluyvera genomosp. 1 TaxID=2774053 RepID=UPI00068B2BB6|nr:dTDP-4-dehydrorhamnose reductase [Kluyvera genomosp. 1]